MWQQSIYFSVVVVVLYLNLFVICLPTGNWLFLFLFYRCILVVDIAFLSYLSILVLIDLLKAKVAISLIFFVFSCLFLIHTYHLITFFWVLILLLFFFIFLLFLFFAKWKVGSFCFNVCNIFLGFNVTAVLLKARVIIYLMRCYWHFCLVFAFVKFKFH